MMIPVMIDRLINMAQPANYRFLPVEFFTSSILKHIHVFEEGYINSSVTGLNTMICPPFFSMPKDVMKSMLVCYILLLANIVTFSIIRCLASCVCLLFMTYFAYSATFIYQRSIKGNYLQNEC